MKEKRRSKKRNNFWSDGLSIDESKFSALVLMAFVGFSYALFSHYRTGDISDSLLDLVQTLIFSIVGVNVANSVADVLQNKREKNDKNNYNE